MGATALLYVQGYAGNTITVSGLAAGNAVRIKTPAGAVEAEAVEVGGVATLDCSTMDFNTNPDTTAGGFYGDLIVYEDDSYAVTLFSLEDIVMWGGSDYAILSDPPVITSIAPDQSIPKAGVAVALTGDKFTDVDDVRLILAGEADIVATDLVVVDDEHITCTFDLSSAALGSWTVRATDTDDDYGELEFFIVGWPAEEGLDPDHGPVGTVVTLTGHGFGYPQGASTIKLNGVLCDVSSWTDTTIVFIVPDTTVGDVVVWVGGTDPEDGLEFVVTPTVSGCTPSIGSTNTFPTVDVNGFGFLPNAVVAFERTPLDINTPEIHSVTKNQIVVHLDWTDAELGKRDVRVSQEYPEV